MKNTLIIIKKQLKDTAKNKTILIQFVLFPIITLVMENLVNIEGMPDNFFTKLFSVMYIGMAPVTSMAAIISEEKEKNTLRVLLMANVKSWQYLAGVGIYVLGICMVGALIMSTNIGENVGIYMLIMAIGFIISIIAGACIGIIAKSQMMATSIVLPFILILSFAPMIAMFNERVENISKIFYTQQIKNCLESISAINVTPEMVIVVAVNAAVFIALFCLAYRKKWS